MLAWKIGTKDQHREQAAARIHPDTSGLIASPWHRSTYTLHGHGTGKAKRAMAPPRYPRAASLLELPRCHGQLKLTS